MSTQQHIENTEAAISFWATVPPNAVVRNLKRFRGLHAEAPSCRSPAGFGRWLTFSPYFAALGVVSGETGRTIIRDMSPALQCDGDVSFALFGCDRMFSPRNEFPADWFHYAKTDHAAMAARLSEHLAYLPQHLAHIARLQLMRVPTYLPT